MPFCASSIFNKAFQESNMYFISKVVFQFSFKEEIGVQQKLPFDYLYHFLALVLSENITQKKRQSKHSPKINKKTQIKAKASRLIMFIMLLSKW